MVQANAAAAPLYDTNINYASFRKDKEPSPGHSRELISDRVDPQYFDNLVA